MNKLSFLALMLAGCLQAADFACEWAVAEKPRNLAEGAIAVEYGDDDAILSIVASPAKGDTITMTGDELPFAAGAKIQIATEGRLVISNAVVCAGDLTVTGCAASIIRSWNDGVASTLSDPTQALLPTNSFRVMFENMDLDEWEPVEFRGDIPANIGPGWYFPNHFKAQYFKRKTVDGERIMEVDLMASDSAMTWTKAVRILLRQNGSNVEGKAIDAWYGGRFYAGMCVEEAALERVTPLHLVGGGVAVPGASNGGYGVSQLTMKRKTPTSLCVLSGAITVPEESKIEVARDVCLQGLIGAIAASSNGGDPEIFPNFHADGMLSLVGDAANSYLRGKISGGGTVAVNGRDEVKRTYNNNGVDYEIPVYEEYGYGSYIYPTAYVRGTENRLLLDLTNVVGELRGSCCPSPHPVANLFHIRRAEDNLSLVGQFQGIKGDWLYCVYATIIQEAWSVSKAWNIRIGALSAWRIAKSQYGKGVDFDALTNSAEKVSVATSHGGDGVAVRSVKCYFSAPRKGHLRNNDSANEMSGDPCLVIAGSDRRTQVYEVGHSGAMPACGKVVIDCGGELQMNCDGALNDGYNGGGAAIVVNEGGRLLVAGKNPIGNEQRIFLDGGEMFLQHDKSHQYGSGPYVQRLILRDGALISGGGIMMGTRNVQEPYPFIKVCGSVSCTIDSVLTVQGDTSNGHRYFDWRIAKVTDGENPDLVMNGAIRGFNWGTTESAMQSTNVTMRKYGEGTILVKGAQNQFGVTRIYKGEYRFGASGIGNGSGYVLQGGRIGAADGTSNELGVLRVEDGAGSIVLGENASLSFADTSSVVWGGKDRVLIDYDGELKPGMLRFGVSKNGLTPAQLVRIRHNGNRVILNDDGYMLDMPKTFRIIIR